MIIDRIRKDMSVIAADDRCVGFVERLDDGGMLRITSISAGFGYDRLIPLSWVSDVDKYVFLDKTSRFVAANWENAPLLAPERAANAAAMEDARQPEAA